MRNKGKHWISVPGTTSLVAIEAVKSNVSSSVSSNAATKTMRDQRWVKKWIRKYQSDRLHYRKNKKKQIKRWRKNKKADELGKV